MTVTPPDIPKAVVFVDGQNLFHAAKEAFGYNWPNYDPVALATRICRNKRWELLQTRFYTGVPDAADNEFWNHFWTSKLAVIGRCPTAEIYRRSLRYRNQTVRLPNGTKHTFLVGQEKGIDVRIALDTTRFALDRHYDVAIIVSQDQDLTEAVEEVKEIACMQNRWIWVASAFPVSPTSENRRGIDKTEWIQITRADYDACLDPRDYRPPHMRGKKR
ncbi:MAG: NYN domain-containing protein [Planctomycetota bacterium]|nr:NYN domain-containing protein [Planctomycetota bacterium]